jgi:hypothetical protein
MVAVNAKLEVHGIQQALAELNKFDPKLRRQITKDIKGGAGAQKIVTQARQFIPTGEPPLSGMRRGTMIKGREATRWNNDVAKAGITIVVARRAMKARTAEFKRDLFNDAPRGQTAGAFTKTVHFNARPFALMVAQQKDAAASIWDHAGIKGLSSIFVNNLIADGDGGYEPTAPRSLIPAVSAAYPEVEQDLSKIVDIVSRETNRNLRIEQRGP